MEWLAPIVIWALCVFMVIQIVALRRDEREAIRRHQERMAEHRRRMDGAR